MKLNFSCSFKCSVRIIIIFASFLNLSHAYPEPVPGSNFKSLGHYNVEPYMTVSGISGGAAFSMMMSFIHSSFIKGAGIFAGAPFPIGIVGLEKLWNVGNFSALTTWTDYLAGKGWIDDPYANMKSNLGAFIYAGSSDQLVPHFFSRINLRQFEHYGVPRVKDMIGQIPSGHCIPINATGEEFDIRMCSIGFYNAVCACSYPGIYEMFRFLYQDAYNPPGYEPGTSGHLFKFNQDEFFDSGSAVKHGFFTHGFAYVPFRCRPETGIRCKIHFAFQGCSQSLLDLWVFKKPPSYIVETGYLEAADANDIIMVFPISYLDPKNVGHNFVGCFDIYSYTDPFRIKYATKWGYQPLAIKRMFERMVHGKFFSKDEFPLDVREKDDFKTKTFGQKLTLRYVKDALREAVKAVGRLGE